MNTGLGPIIAQSRLPWPKLQVGSANRADAPNLRIEKVDGGAAVPLAVRSFEVGLHEMALEGGGKEAHAAKIMNTALSFVGDALRRQAK